MFMKKLSLSLLLALALGAPALAQTTVTLTTVPKGGTGRETLTNFGVLIGAGTGPITILPAAGSGTVLTGVTGANPAFTNTPTLGVAGASTGTLSLAGATSGTVTIQPQAAAGTYNFNLPTGAGSAGQPLLSGGGGVAAQTYGTLGVFGGGTNCSVASGTCLDNITGFAATGLQARIGAGAYAFRTLGAPAAGLAITNPDGVAGAPSFALANDLAALEGLAGTGIAVRTGADAWAQRTLQGTANEIAIANGDGVAGNPAASLPAALTFTGKTVTGGTFSGPTITARDNVFTLQDDADNTKQAQFQLSGIATATTRTFTLPNASTTVVGTDATQTLTNKTIDGNSNTLTVLAGTQLSGQAPIANGGTGQSTAAAARGSAGLNVERVTSVGDAAYTILATDRTVVTSAALTAARIWTLPAANAVNAGGSICIIDAAGGVTGTNTLTVQRAGADTVNGSTSTVINAARDGRCLYSNGSSAWSFIPSSAGGGSGTVTSVTCNGGTTTITTSGTCASRETLTAARTYYVRTDGNDACNGMTDAGGASGACAFLTPQKAYNVIKTLDLNGNNVTVQIRDGTYAPASGTPVLNLDSGWVGGNVTFQGNSVTPANVVFSTTSSSAISVSAFLGGTLTLKDFKITTTTSGNALQHTGVGLVQITNLDFGALGGGGIGVFVAANSAQVSAIGNYAISGGTTGQHWQTINGGAIACVGRTITITGTPAFGIFAYANRLSSIEAYSNTYSGAATGKRYQVDHNSVLFTNGGGANALPGDTAGTTATGGQYI